MRPKPLMPTLMVMLMATLKMHHVKRMLQYADFDRGRHVLRREAEVLEQFGRRRRLAEAVDADHRAFQPDVLAPEVGDAGLDRDARQPCGSTLARYAVVLAVEHGGGGHGHDAHRDARAVEQLLRVERELHFGAGGDQITAAFAPGASAST